MPSARKEIHGIHIAKSGHYNCRSISSNSSFFVPDEDIIIKIEESKVIFKKPTLDYTGNTHKVKVKQSGWMGMTVKCELPIGRFEFDLDESNEDEKVIYFADN